MPSFEIVSEITNRQTIARGSGIRELERLRRLFGDGNWRKCKGEATVQLPDGKIRRVELHPYEAHGTSRRLMKRKRYLD